MRKNLLLVSLIAAAMSLGVVGCNKPKPATSSAETPSQTPSENPSENPSEEPSENPSEEPSENPSEEPSENPSEDPSEEPSETSEEPSESSEEPSESSEDPSETHTYGVSVDNKTSLTEEWHVGDAGRTLNLTITIDGEEGNAQQAINKGELTIESSNSQIVAVQGKVITPVAAGEATITVNYHDASDTFDVTVLAKEGAKVKYGTEHDGTLEDPFSNEDAIKVTKDSNYNNEEFYVGGEIASFYHAPGARDDGAVSWFLKPAQEGGEKFEIYKCFGTNQTPLTDDDVWVNGYAIAKGTFTTYNDQCETNEGSVFVSCEGNKPSPRTVIESTFAEALAAGAALADGADTYDYYQFDAYVTVKDGKNYFLTATKGEALNKQKSDADHGTKDYYANAFEIYNASDDVAAKLTKDAKVTVKSIVKNYHGQVENLLALTAEDVTVIEAGGEWVETFVEVNVAGALTAAKALEDNATSTETYKVTGIIKTTESWSSQYNNVSFTVVDDMDDTESIKVFRWSCTQEEAAELVVGYTAIFTGKLQNYVKDDVHTYELTSPAKVSIEPPAPVEPESIVLDTEDFSLNPGGEKTITATIGPDGATGDISWSVDPADVGVTVTDGHVEVDAGTAEGEYTITATVVNHETINASVVLTVTTASVPAESVELDHDSLEFEIPGAISTAQLTASVLPANTTDTAVWSSNDETVATVSSSGLVTAVGAGTATITVTCGGVSDSCTVTVNAIDLGTELSPLSVSTLLTRAPLFCEQSNGSYAEDMAVVTGKVTSVKYDSSYQSGKYNITIADLEDPTKTIKATGVDYTGSEQAIFVNDVVTIQHYLEYYNGWSLYFKTIETVKHYGTVLSREAGTSAITLNASHATVTGLEESYENDETATFTVAVDSGYELVSVKAGSTTLEADGEGNYSFTVQGNMTVTVETQEEGGAAVQSVTADFSLKTANHSAYGDTWTYGDFTVSGGANNNGQWAFVKMGGKSATISAEGYPGTYIKTNNAISFGVAKVALTFVDQCYNQDNEKASVHIEAYSDSSLTTKVAETTSQEVPAIAKNGEPVTLNFQFASPTTGLYYKVVFDITNTTTYNGVVALKSVVFSDK